MLHLISTGNFKFKIIQGGQVEVPDTVTGWYNLRYRDYWSTPVLQFRDVPGKKYKERKIKDNEIMHNFNRRTGKTVTRRDILEGVAMSLEMWLEQRKVNIVVTPEYESEIKELLKEGIIKKEYLNDSFHGLLSPQNKVVEVVTPKELVIDDEQVTGIKDLKSNKNAKI